jgi:hypothetical protein
MNTIQIGFINHYQEFFTIKNFIFCIFAFLICAFIKYLFSKDEIIFEIEKIKNKTLTFSEKISYFTKINTKINRDYLEHSKFYNEKGFHEIFGKEIENSINNVNKDKINKDIKKVKFSDIIIYDCEN